MYICIYIYIYISLLLQLYNCTRINIVKYRQSIAFSIINICGHSSVAREGKRLQKVAQVAICSRSKDQDVFIGCQHQLSPRYCLGQGIGVTPSLGNAPYRLQRVQFVAY